MGRTTSTWRELLFGRTNKNHRAAGSRRRFVRDGRSLRMEPLEKRELLSVTPAGYWELDETSGTTAFDTSGNTLNGTLVGGAQWTPGGKLGGAIDLDGSGPYVEISDSDLLDDTSELTVSTWVYADSHGGQGRATETFTVGNSASSVSVTHDLLGRNSGSGAWQLAVSNGANAFANQATVPLAPSVTWEHVMAGDFNGDGIDDVVGRNQATGEWTVALNDGDGTFSIAVWTRWSTSVTWLDVMVGDFNGDGYDDIVGRVESSGDWWVATSNGGNGFANARWTRWSTSVTWLDVMVGDFTGDGCDDIVGRVESSGDWWVGESTGTALVNAKWTRWSASVTWLDVMVGDFNGDGRDDLVGHVAENGAWWVGASIGTAFANTEWTRWSTGVTWLDVTVGDFNGDGHDDLVGRDSTSGNWQVGVSTSAAFTNATWGTWSAAAWADVTVGDFNADGLADIVGRHPTTGNWQVGLSTGTAFTSSPWGNWSPTVTWNPVFVGNFAPPGQTPTATITGVPTSPEEGRPITLRASVTDPDAGETFIYAWVVRQGGKVYATGSDASLLFTPNDNGSYAVTLIVTDSDGRRSTVNQIIEVANAAPSIIPITDLAGRNASSSGNWQLAVSNGANAFANQATVPLAPSVTWEHVMAGDFNGDGIDDVVGRNQATGEWTVALNDGDGTFSSQAWTYWSTGVTWLDVMVGDFNGDGNDDLVGRNASNGDWWVATSNGGNGFANARWTRWSTSVTWLDVMVGDFNGDGRDDIVGRVESSGDWWMGESTGTAFVNVKWTRWSASVTWLDVMVGDFNGDGRDDLVGHVAENGAWWVGASIGTAFANTEWTRWSTGVTWLDVTVGDFNGDGHDDLVGRDSTSGNWQVGVSTGNAFSNATWDTWSAAAWADVMAADFNGDGLADIVGRHPTTGQWLVGLSTGAAFSSSQWGTWDSAVTWAPVFAGNFSPSPFRITVDNTSGTPEEGAAITLDCSVTDPGTADTFTYAWSVTKEGDTTPYATSTNGDFTFTPDDNGAYVVTLTVTDNDGGQVTATQAIAVANAAPTVTITGVPTTPVEGTEINLSAAVTDPGMLDTEFTYAWTVAKDGTAYASGTGATLAFIPDDNATYLVSVTATDKDGGQGTASETIVVGNVAPTVTITGIPAAPVEGTEITLIANATDPGVLDTEFTFAWTVTKNGTAYASGTGATLAFIPDDNATYLVSVTATDKDGGQGTASETIVVGNVAPTVTITGIPASPVEGTEINLGCSVTDPGTLDTIFTYAWTVTKDGAAYTTGTADTLAFTPDDNATYLVTVTATDKDGGQGTASETIIVGNVAPTVTISGIPTSPAEGTEITLGASVTDPGSLDTEFTFAWTVTKNGEAYASGTADTLAFTPDDSATYLVTVTATDKDGGQGTASETILVANVAPTITISGALSVDEYAIYTLNLSVDAPGAHVITQWSVDWGDGPDPVVYVGNPASVTHVYETPGQYTITATATDENGDYTAPSISVLVINNLFLDNADADHFTPVGDGWTTTTPTDAFAGDQREHATGTGDNTATWSTTLTPGVYDVYATWAPQTGAATNAQFIVYDDATVLTAPAPVDQSVAPQDDVVGGRPWTKLGTYQVSPGRLIVQLTDSANGTVLADAIRIVANPQAIPFVVNAVADVTISGTEPLPAIDLADVFGDDTEGAQFTYSIVNNDNAELVAASIEGSQLTLTPQGTKSGTAWVVVRATNTVTGLSAETSFAATRSTGESSSPNSAPNLLGLLPDVVVDEDASPHTVTLSDYFADANGDSLDFSVDSPDVLWGDSSFVTAEVNDGRLTLEFASNKYGRAVITVRATDSSGLEVTDSFHVTVVPVDDAPVAGSGMPVTLGEDDRDGYAIHLATHFTMEELTPGEGCFFVIDNPHPSIFATTLVDTVLTILPYPNRNTADLQDASALQPVTVYAIDAAGRSASLQLFVTVASVNDAPQTPYTEDAPYELTVKEDATDCTLDVTRLFTDVDLTTNLNEHLTYYHQGTPPNIISSLTISGTTLSIDLKENAHGTATFTISAHDSHGAIATATVELTIEPVNDAPVVEDASLIPSPNPFTSPAAGESQTASFDLAGLFSDPDEDNLVLTAFVSSGNAGILSQPPSINGSSQLELTFEPEQYGTATLTIRASDAAVYRDVTFDVHVTQPRTLYVIEGDDNTTGAGEDDPGRSDVVSFTVTPSDLHLSGTLEYSLVNAPAGSQIDPATGLFTWEVTEADGGQDVAFEVKAIRTSNPDVFATQRITIRVLDENRPPESSGIPQQTVQEESLLEINLSEYFTDTDVPGGDLTFSLEDAPLEWFNDDGSLQVMLNAQSGLLTWTPAEKHGPKTYGVTVRATDVGGLSATTSLAVVVTEKNDAPVLQAIDDVRLSTAQHTSFLLYANDPDNCVSELTFDFVGDPPVDASLLGSCFSWVPTPALEPGDYSITVRVTDPDGLSDTQTFTIQVANPGNNDPPEFIGNSWTDIIWTALEGNNAIGDSAYPTDFFALDFYQQRDYQTGELPAQLRAHLQLTGVQDSQTAFDYLTFELLDGPDGATLSADGVLDWTYSINPQNPTNLPATYRFTIAVTDDGTPSLTTVKAVHGHIRGPNGWWYGRGEMTCIARDFGLTIPKDWVEDVFGSYPYGLFGSSTFSINIVNGPSNGSLDAPEGNGMWDGWLYTPNSGFVGIDSLQFTIENEFGLSNVATCWIIVGNPDLVDFEVQDQFELDGSPTPQALIPLNTGWDEGGMLTEESDIRLPDYRVAGIAASDEQLRTANITLWNPRSYSITGTWVLSTPSSSVHPTGLAIYDSQNTSVYFGQEYAVALNPGEIRTIGLTLEGLASGGNEVVVNFTPSSESMLNPESASVCISVGSPLLLFETMTEEMRLHEEVSGFVALNRNYDQQFKNEQDEWIEDRLGWPADGEVFDTSDPDLAFAELFLSSGPGARKWRLTIPDSVRAWRMDGTAVVSDQWYSDLDWTGTVRYWIEGTDLGGNELVASVGFFDGEELLAESADKVTVEVFSVDLSIQGITELQEEIEGLHAIIGVNDNFDEQNPHPNRSGEIIADNNRYHGVLVPAPLGAVEGDNNLIPAIVTFGGDSTGGKYWIEVRSDDPDPCIRIWDSSFTSAPTTREEAAAAPSGGATVNLWIEGLKQTTGSIELVAHFVPKNLDVLARDPRTIHDSAALVFARVDLNVDSDNDGIIGSGGLYESEDFIEDDPTLPGKYVPVNDGDADGDGIVDFADWEYASATNNRFVPIEVTIPSTASANATVTFQYDASDPSQVTEDEASGTWQLPAAGHLRLWKHGGNEARTPDASLTGDYLAPDTAYNLTALGWTPGATYTLYLEGVKPSAALGSDRIEIILDPDGDESTSSVLTDAVRVTVIAADIDVDSDNSGEIDATAAEDQIEVPAEGSDHLGKVVMVNAADADGDFVPDFADGIELFGNGGADASAVFTPVQFTIPEPIDLDQAVFRFIYAGSDPAALTYDPYRNVYLLPSEGYLRLWTLDGTASRSPFGVREGGDYVTPGGDSAPGIYFTAEDLGMNSDRTATLYLEAVAGCYEFLDITLEIDPDGPTGAAGWVASDAVQIASVGIDLRVDSDNSGVYDAGNWFVQDPAEDQIEHWSNDDGETSGGSSSSPIWGKVIHVNDGDRDSDGVPNWADGFNGLGNEGADASAPFTPMYVAYVGPQKVFDVAKIVFKYDASSPNGVLRAPADNPYDFVYSIPLTDGGLRLWTVDGNISRDASSAVGAGGNYVAPDTKYSLANLSGVSHFLFIEALKRSSEIGSDSISVYLDLSGESGGQDDDKLMLADQVTLTLVQVDLDVDTDNTGDVDRSELEDQFELCLDASSADFPGVGIAPNNGDADGDGIPDFADFIGSDDTLASAPLTPVIFELFGPIDYEVATFSFFYVAADPLTLTRKRVGEAGDYRLAWVHIEDGVEVDNRLRLWNCDGAVRLRNPLDVAEGGNFITPGAVYTMAQLGVSGSVATLFVEGIGVSSAWAGELITVYVDPDGPDGPIGPIAYDAVRATVAGSMVSVAAIDAYAAEPGDGAQATDTAAVLITRGEGNVYGDLKVYFSLNLDGPAATTATWQDDFTVAATPGGYHYDASTNRGWVVIPNGWNSVQLAITPVADSETEWDERITIRLESPDDSSSGDAGTPAYSINPAAAEAFVTIFDDDKIEQANDLNTDVVSIGESAATVGGEVIFVGVQKGNVTLVQQMGTSAFTPQYVGSTGAYPIVVIDAAMPTVPSSTITAAFHFADRPVVNSSITLGDAQSDTLYRFAFQVDASDLPTGQYDYDVQFTVQDGDGNQLTRTVRGTIAVVNRLVEAGNHFGNGWWVPGLEQLVVADGSAPLESEADTDDTTYRLANQGAATSVGAALIRSDNSAAWFESSEDSLAIAAILDDETNTDIDTYVETGEPVSPQWATGTGIGGFRGDYRYTASNEAEATYTFEDLEPGKTYQLFATWVAGPDRNAEVVYEVTGATRLRDSDGESTWTVTVNQRYVPGETTILDTQWRSLGYFQVGEGGGDVTVTLSGSGVDSGAGLTIADGLLVVGHWEYETPLGSFSQLEYNNGEYALRTKHGEVHQFDHQGRMTESTDRLGNSVTFDYKEPATDSAFDDHLAKVTDAYGLETTYEYGGANETLSEVLDFAERKTEFSGTSELMVTMPDPGYGGEQVRWTFSYNADGLLNKVTDPRWYENWIWYDHYRFTQAIIATETVDEAIWSLRPQNVTALMNSGAATTSGPEQFGALYTDARDNQWAYQTDAFGYITQRRNPAPFEDVWQWERHDNGLLHTYREPAGGGGWGETLGELETKYYYDNRESDYGDDGNLTKVLYADGTREEWAYEGAIALAFGQATAHRLFDEQDQVYRHTSYTLNGRGSVSEKAEHNTQGGPDRLTRYEYTPSGNPDSELPAGLVTAVTVAAGTDDEVTTRTTYYTLKQWLGLPFIVTEAYGTDDAAAVKFTYDSQRNPLITFDELNRPTGSLYDNLGRLVRIVESNPGTSDHNAPVTEYAYDAMGNLASVTDARRNIIRYDYNGRNRLNAVTTPATHQTAAAITRYEYDKNGNKTAVVDTFGTRTTLEYDERNLHTGTYQVSPGGPSVAGVSADVYAAPSTTISYDTLGNVASVTDARGNVTKYTYYARKRQQSVIEPATSQHGESTTTTYYYADGQKKTVYTPGPNGMRITSYQYLCPCQLRFLDFALVLPCFGTEKRVGGAGGGASSPCSPAGCGRNRPALCNVRACTGQEAARVVLAARLASRAVSAAATAA